MKTFQFLVAAILLATLPIIGAAQPGSGSWCGNNNNYNRLFDAKTIVELNGTIEKIEKITPEKGMSTGVHLLVKTGKTETISVHLGPSWYLDNQELQFVVGDKISIKGSKITYQNAPAVIAMSVTRGEHVLMLREKNGAPKWNAWQQGQGKGKGKGGRKQRMNG
ncbi:MAG: DNA-binding protein [Saprospiraceae bacterium]|nr:DNA-binding protein [Saprospiraceae bacterium]